MYDALIRRLGDRFRAVALDYPGFGNSDAPPPGDFAYTFANLANVVAGFADALGLSRYTLFMQDYGAPVGMRLALVRPSAVDAMIFQNGNIYAEGLGPMWEHRKAYWLNRAGHEAAVQAGHLSLATTRARHVGDDPDVEAYDPNLWIDEVAYLTRQGVAALQMELIYDYQTNIALYPAWQEWLRRTQLPTLVLWGRHDRAFLVEGAMAFRRDLTRAEIQILEAGHFAMGTCLDEIAELTQTFLRRLHDGGSSTQTEAGQ